MKIYQQQIEENLKKCEDVRTARYEKLSIYSALAEVANKIKINRDRIKQKKNKSAKDKDKLKKLKKASKRLANKTVIRYDNKKVIPFSIIRDRYQVKKNKIIKSVVEGSYIPKIKAFNLRDPDALKNIEDSLFGPLGLQEFPEIYQNTINFHNIYKDREGLDTTICAKNYAINYMSNYSSIYNTNKDVIDRCEIHYPTNMLSKLFGLIDNSLPFLLEGDIFNALYKYKNKGDFLNAIIGSECESKKIKIPENLDCKIYSPHNQYYAKNRSKESIIDYMRNKIHKNLSEKKAIGIGVCSMFLDEPGHRSMFGKDELCKSYGENRFHALSVVGYKEEKNEAGNMIRKYLVQNSWGSNCGLKPLKENCIEDTGRFWIEESILLENVKELNEVTYN